jgi:hypothetical protein
VVTQEGTQAVVELLVESGEVVRDLCSFLGRARICNRLLFGKAVFRAPLQKEGATF